MSFNSFVLQIKRWGLKTLNNLVQVALAVSRSWRSPSAAARYLQCTMAENTELNWGRLVLNPGSTTSIIFVILNKCFHLSKTRLSHLSNEANNTICLRWAAVRNYWEHLALQGTWKVLEPFYLLSLCFW